MNNNNINQLIMDMCKNFEQGGVKNFLTHFDMSSNRVVNHSMYIGKVNNITYMSNANALEGYIKFKEGTAKFCFSNLNKAPWTDVYNLELKKFIWNETIKNFREHPELKAKLDLLLNARNNYKELVIRALNKGFVKFKDLHPYTKKMLGSPEPPKPETNKETKDKEKEQHTNDSNVIILSNYSGVADCSAKSNNEDLYSNVMKLAHNVRISEKLEGHYHVQMKMALKMAHAIIKKHKEKHKAALKEVAADMNQNKDERLITINVEETKETKEVKNKTLKEVIAENINKYETMVCYIGSTVYIRTNGEAHTCPTSLTGSDVEKWICEVLTKGKDKFKNALVIYHYDVFDKIKMKGVDFIKIPC